MQNERTETESTFGRYIHSETASNIGITLAPNPDSTLGNETNESDPFSDNSAVLQARKIAAEARESDQELRISKARQALAEAKIAVNQEKQSVATAPPTEKSQNDSSNANQRLTGSRILQPKQNEKPLANVLQFSSSICAVIGGVLLSSNTDVSKYGFILLACSSSQIFLSSMLLKQKNLMIYGASVFILVDCLGIYRWLLNTPH